MFTTDVTQLVYWSGLIVPLLVGFVTKLRAGSGVKAMLNLVLSAVIALVAQAVTDEGVFTTESAYAVFATWVVSMASYHGFWRPTGIAGAIAVATRGFGVGPESPDAGHLDEPPRRPGAADPRL